MTAPIVVFDTSGLLSAVGWQGKPLQCLELARAGQIRGVSCREILDELAAKLLSKLDFTAEQVADTIADFLRYLELVTITGDLHVVPADPRDDMIVECAVVAAADYIVSGDRRHLLVMESYQNIRIIGPGLMLTKVLGQSET